METHLNWKKGFFSNTYKVFYENAQIGELKEKTWSQSAEGILNKKSYRFKTKGFFKQETEITDYDNNVVIGKITYNSWGTKAVIEHAGKKYNWRYNNVWNTKWRVFDADKTQIDYHGSSTKGRIALNDPDEVLILSGLYIRNYYLQITVVVLTVLVIFLYSQQIT